MTLDEFAAQLDREIVGLHPRMLIGLAEYGEQAKKLSRSYPGHYQEGWAPLAASTLEHKKGPGPLLETGEMKESIEFKVEPGAMAMVLGSPEKKALWQEMGTHRIPPRPFLGLAMKKSLPLAAEVFGKLAIRMIAGR